MSRIDNRNGEAIAAPNPRFRKTIFSVMLTALVGFYSSELYSQDVNLSRITNVALDHFNLYDGQIVTLNQDVGTVASGNMSITFSFETQSYTLDLWPHSTRAANYQIVAQVADGSYQNIQPGLEKTMRGTVREIEGSVVGASMLRNGLHAMILLPDNKKIWIEPFASAVVMDAGVTDAGATDAGATGVDATGVDANGVGATGGLSASAITNHHMVYRGEDVIPANGQCSLHIPPRNDAARSIKFQSDTTVSGTVAGEFLRITELAIDADFEYYKEEDSSVTNVEEKVTSIISTMNIQYERDVQIHHLITRIIVRTTAAEDPYTSLTDPNTLLYQLKYHWDMEQTNVQRDVVQLFTGNNLTNGVIGIAWLGMVFRSTICGSWGYSVVESNCGFSCFSFSKKTDLSAHELGHNWGAGHCTCPNWTMNPSIQGANKFEPTFTIPDIITFRDRRDCLDEGDELTRIIMSSDSGEVEEGGSTQITVTANFRFGVDQDVTTEAVWSVDPPEAGDVDSNGVFTAAQVNRTTCVTITASYTFDGVTRFINIVISVMDLDTPLSVVATDPPNDGIDARIPSNLDGANPTGWQIFDITLSGDVCGVTEANFMVSVEGGFNTPPSIVAFQGGISADTVRVILSNPIEPGAWTTITHIDSGSSIRVGFLPGDVNSDGINNAQDIQTLLDSLAVGGDLTPLSAKDIDRSGLVKPQDITVLIDLLNGADSFDYWLGESLP